MGFTFTFPFAERSARIANLTLLAGESRLGSFTSEPC